MKLTKKQLEIIKKLEALTQKDILKNCSAIKKSFIKYDVDYQDMEDLQSKVFKFDRLVKKYKICKAATLNGGFGIAFIL